MKQKKRMIALLIMFLALVIVYKAQSRWNEHTKEREKEAAANDMIHVTDADSVTALRYTDGESTMSFVKKDDTWYYETDKEIPMSQSVVENMANLAAGLTAVRKLDEPDAMEDYGLTEPVYTVWLTDGEEELPVYIGNMSGDDYYATVGDTGDVYTITDDLVYSLTFDLSELVENDTVPGIGSGNLKKVEITQNGETTVYEEEEDLGELAGGFGTLEFGDCADYHVTEETIASYGLDGENRITVAAVYKDSDTGEEETFTVYIGKADEDGANRYVMKEGSKMVYRVGSGIVENMITVES